MSFFSGDVLTEWDYAYDWVNAEDFLAGMMALGFQKTKSQQMWVAIYAFVGSSLGRFISKLDMGPGAFGNMAAAAQIQTDALFSTIIQAALAKFFMKASFMNAFEKSAATQVIAKCVGRKLQALSKGSMGVMPGTGTTGLNVPCPEKL